MRTTLLMIIVLFIFQCGAPNRNQEEASDSVTVNNDSSKNAEVPVIESSGTDNIISFNPTDSLEQSVFLQWKEVSYSDYGPLYIFEDRKGEALRIRLIEIPDWDFENNNYIDITYPSESMYPVITLKEETVGKWYKVVLKMESRQLDGVEGYVPTIKSFEVAYSFE